MRRPPLSRTSSSELVTLPSGITVRKLPGWLPDSCPEVEEHDALPTDFDDKTGLSATLRQARHSVCGLWTQWVPRAPGDDHDIDDPYCICESCRSIAAES
jgi:hypothetical protein